MGNPHKGVSFQKLKEIAGTPGEAGNPAGVSWQGVRDPRIEPGSCALAWPALGASPLRGGAGPGPGGRPLSQAALRARRQFGHVPGHVAPAVSLMRSLKKCAFVLLCSRRWGMFFRRHFLFH